MLKRSFFVLIGSLIMVACNAQDNSSAYRDGEHYQTLPRPVATQDPSRIEVVEVFWYGCIHCFRLESALEEWVDQLPEDVNFVRVPAMWAPVMELHARMYYAAVALGVLDQVHWPIFREMNERGNQLASEEAILNFVASQGVDREQFRRAFNSFGVTSQVTQARSKAAAYGVRGTPELVVEGKYRISTSMVGSQNALMDVASALIASERRARTAGQ